VTAVVGSVAVGLGAGVLAGMFGIGGGVLTTPAVRLLLGYPALIAVGTPLLALIPGALAGAVTHVRAGTANLRTGLAVGAWGALGALVGARGSAAAGGTVVMLVTAVVIVWGALAILRRPRSAQGAENPDGSMRTSPHRAAIALTGIATGLYAGFLGLGGGVVLVPILHRFFGYSMKAAVGTSLVAISVLAVPGALAHWWLGHVDLLLAVGLGAGAVPGAVLGARLASAASDRGLRIGFAVLLGVIGVLLALTEVAAL
jgi:uncharacterized protein